MEIIPSINCPDFDCVKKRLEQVKQMGSEWAHIDVADGEFTKIVTWRNPEELKNLNFSGVNLEVHLMVLEPEGVMVDWLDAGAKRIILHQEGLKNGWKVILEKCKEYDAELMLAIKPETPVENLTNYLDDLGFVQFLAVSPGPAGQEFNPVVLEKIRQIKSKTPDIRVEIDGGINPETARLAKKAGADILVSASYIWDFLEPKIKLEELRNIS